MAAAAALVSVWSKNEPDAEIKYDKNTTVPIYEYRRRISCVTLYFEAVIYFGTYY